MLTITHMRIDCKTFVCDISGNYCQGINEYSVLFEDGTTRNFVDDESSELPEGFHEAICVGQGDFDFRRQLLNITPEEEDARAEAESIHEDVRLYGMGYND